MCKYGTGKQPTLRSIGGFLQAFQQSFSEIGF